MIIAYLVSVDRVCPALRVIIVQNAKRPHLPAASFNFHVFQTLRERKTLLLFLLSFLKRLDGFPHAISIARTNHNVYP